MPVFSPPLRRISKSVLTSFDQIHHFWLVTPVCHVLPLATGSKRQLAEQTTSSDMQKLTLKSEYLDKMIRKRTLGQKEWHSSSKIGSSSLPTPSNSSCNSNRKDQEDVCSSESTVEKSQQYITAAMDKEEQTQTILLSICSFTFSEHKPKHWLVLNFRYRCPNLLRSFTDLEFSLPEAPITK